MISSFKAERPDKIEFTLTATMNLADWVNLRNALERSKWPAPQLYDAICDMVAQANKSFTPSVELHPPANPNDT